MKSITGSLLLALTCAFGATAAHAADAAKSDAAAAVTEACKGDVEKLCPGIQPGEGRIAACLKQHKSEVSKPCKSEIAKQHKAKKASAA